jgi:hypothetical protein
LNWLGDSLDGTLARVRDRQRYASASIVLDAAGTLASSAAWSVGYIARRSRWRSS